MRCAIYARVSTDMSSQKDSLENQQTFFENFIIKNGWEKHDIYPDEGITGTSTAKRGELQRLMKDAELRKFNAVLVKSLSRWARDTVDSITLVRKLKSYGIVLITIDDNYNSLEDRDEMKLTMYSMFAQQESEAASKRVSFGIAEKSRKGVFHGTPPYGYDKVKGKLVPNPIHAPTVQLIFRLYLQENWGWQKIANYLTDKGIPTPRQVLGAKNAGKIWHETAVKIILNNRHYTGDLVQGRSKVDKEDKLFHQEKGYKKRNDIDEERWLVCKDAHPPLITHEEFTLSQGKIAFKARKIYRGKGKKSLFARIACCADCGKGMNYKNDRKGYVCATYQKNGSKKCASHFIEHTVLRDAVLNDLQHLSSNVMDCDSLVESAQMKANAKVTRAKNDMLKVQKKLKVLQQEQLELVRHLTRKTIDEDTFKLSNDTLKSDIQSLKDRAIQLEIIVSQEQDHEGSMNRFKEEVIRLAELDITEEQVLRGILERLIERIEVAVDGSITIHYSFKNPLLQGA
ncbi:MAG: recombinase family protein [Paenibacillus sp.]|uniref:recombinase family protein n=1 Tax=Paenibacillus sp. TaxID=58172 RepID=UPI00290FCE3C|nr:recombinase family protein [Paenibacillus sp.]MDU4695847.1 recombinase family protein [Paenibacillus sp.]